MDKYNYQHIRKITQFNKDWPMIRFLFHTHILSHNIPHSHSVQISFFFLIPFNQTLPSSFFFFFLFFPLSFQTTITAHAPTVQQCRHCCHIWKPHSIVPFHPTVMSRRSPSSLPLALPFKALHCCRRLSHL